MRLRIMGTFLCGLLWVTAGLAAEKARPGFLHPDVLRAALTINLTDEQKPVFQQAITVFAQKRINALGKLMRGNDQSGIPRKWRTRTKKYLKEMDKTLKPVLSEEQWPAYLTYRTTLEKNLRTMR